MDYLTPKMAQALLDSQPPISESEALLIEMIAAGEDDEVISDTMGLGSGRNVRCLNMRVYAEFKEFFE